MGGTPRLPDVNVAFMRHRDNIIRALQEKNHALAMGEINAFNACLPPDYRVLISDEQYEQDTTTQLFYECYRCRESTLHQSVYRYFKPLSPLEALGSKARIKEVWKCPKCDRLCDMAKTQVVQEKIQDPSYLKVVPSPPQRTKYYFRLEYELAFTVWGWHMLGELEGQAALYRDDSWVHDDDELEVVAGGET